MTRALGRVVLTALLALASARAQAEPAVHALLLNGGGSPEENFASHLEHLRAALGWLDQAGVPRADGGASTSSPANDVPRGRSTSVCVAGIATPAAR